jgi:hypothetical protein
VLVREELRALHFRALEQQAGLEFTGGGRAARAAAPATAPPADADARGGRLSGPEETAAPSAAGEGGDGDGGSSSGGAGAEARDDAKSIALDSAAVAAADDGGFFSFHRGNLPRRCAAFLQALLAVGEPPRRLALLRKVGLLPSALVDRGDRRGVCTCGKHACVWRGLWPVGPRAAGY